MKNLMINNNNSNLTTTIVILDVITMSMSMWLRRYELNVFSIQVLDGLDWGWEGDCVEVVVRSVPVLSCTGGRNERKGFLYH